MKKLTLLLCFLMLTACNDVKKVSSKIEISDIGNASTFIIECAKAANPMSDEEGEDLVRQCEITAESLYGTRVYYIWDDYSVYCETKSVHDTRQCWNTLKHSIIGKAP